MRNAKELLTSVNIVDVINKYVPLTRKGSEYYGKCPFHDDHKDSLQVNESKQIFKCFVCGPGGDAISFLQELGNTFNESCDILEGHTTGIFDPIQRTVATRAKWQQTNPEYPANVISHYLYDSPAQTWAYTDKYGYTIGYVCRFNFEDGSKQTIPYVFATNGSRSEWRWMGFSNPRPLFNRHFIERYPDATVIIVEGEKCAEFGQSYYEPERFIFTTWPGGSGAIKHVDWSPLEGRNVIKWADNDEPGKIAMNQIPIDAKFINIPSHLPKKWDIADRNWQNFELDGFIEDNLTDEPYSVESDEVIPDETPKQEPIQAKTEKSSRGRKPFDNEHFRVLGYERYEEGKIRYHFYSYHAKMIISLTPTQMTKSNLIVLAPLNWLEQLFPGKSSSFSADSAVQFLVGHGNAAGVFNPKKIRGRGAWLDGDDIVIHDGESLRVNGLRTELVDYPSDYIYEIAESFQFGNSKAMNVIESKLLMDQFKFINWDRGEVAAKLCAGWCVIAPICGVLDWRSHLWITGAAGSGKSWIMDNMIRSLVGNVALIVQGQSTSSGIRSQLGNDARPVLFDESDVTNQRDKDRISDVISLARLSSYKDGGEVVKGTASGGARSYQTKAIYAFASIGVQLVDQSDRSRFTILSVKPSKGDFKKFSREFHQLVTKSYAQRLQARTIKHLKTLKANIEQFSDAFTFVLGNKRTADQLSALMAGWYLLESDGLISFDEAVKIVQSYQWEDEIGLDSTRDEIQLFERIMTTQIRVEDIDSRIVDRTIGEMVNCAGGVVPELHSKVYAKNADAVLRRIGILVSQRAGRVYISTSNSSGVWRILKDTNWANNYGRILERLPDARTETARQFTAGLKSRCVSIPMNQLIDDTIGNFEFISDEF
jgi:putative DNA primase/helicase